MQTSKEKIWIVSSALVVIVAMCSVKYCTPLDQSECRVTQNTTELMALPGEDAVGTFTIHNDGKSDLDFSISPSCQCTKSTPSSGSIRPGESELVRVFISPLKELDAVRPATVEIQTNEPGRSRHRVDFSVSKSMPWNFATRTASFGVISQQKYQGQVRALDLVAASNLQAPAPAPQLKVIGGSEQITGKVTATGSNSWRIEFGLSPDIPVGQYTTNFAIGTAEHPEIARIPVFLRITENIAIRPVMTMLGANETEPVTVEIQGVDCELSESIVRVSEDPGVRLIQKLQLSPSRVRVTLDLGPEYRKSLPRKVRLIAQGLGESELLCVSSGTRLKQDLHVAHPNTVGSQP